MWGDWGGWFITRNIITKKTFTVPFVIEDRVRVDAIGNTDLYIVFNNKNEDFSSSVPARINFDSSSSSSSKWYN
jgi:hypothetical protein